MAQIFADRLSFNSNMVRLKVGFKMCIIYNALRFNSNMVRLKGVPLSIRTLHLQTSFNSNMVRLKVGLNVDFSVQVFNSNMVRLKVNRRKSMIT